MKPDPWENSGQVSETTDDGLPLTTTGLFHLMKICQQAYHIPVEFTYTSGVASIVAPGGGDEESRVLYDNGDGDLF